ncbi:MAG: ComEC/Rec2 family competence protein [Candidatus Paceibacterota bacterium]
MIKILRQHIFMGLAGFVWGVLVFSLWTQLSFYFILFLYLLGLVLIFLSLLKYRTVKLIFSLPVVILLGFILGFLRADVFESKLKGGEDLTLESKVSVVGQIIKEPDIRDSSTRLVVKVDDIKTRILVVTNIYQKFNYGDRVLVSGVVLRPANFINEHTGRKFDYINYLKRDKIVYQISFAEVEKIQTNFDLGFLVGVQKTLFQIKNDFNHKFSLLITEPASSLLAGILTGDRRGLGVEWEDKFRRAGLIHIVVLSGYNITIVAVVIVSLLSYFLSKKVALILSIVGLVVFTLAVGAGPAVARASLMATIAILARLGGRTYLAGVGTGWFFDDLMEPNGACF